MDGVLDLGAGLGVALVPASTALLGVEDLALRPPRRRQGDAILALLRLRGDSHPLLPMVGKAVAAIFGSIEPRIAQASGRL